MEKNTCRLGTGVMIQMLGAHGSEKHDALKDVKGRRIASVTIDDAANGGDGALLFMFDGGWKLAVADKGRSCCESRYLKCDDDLAAYVGATFQEITIECGDTMNSKYDECHEVQFLLIHTNRGIFTVNTHNAHNGYYGGFWMTADVTAPGEVAP